MPKELHWVILRAKAGFVNDGVNTMNDAKVSLYLRNPDERQFYLSGRCLSTQATEHFKK